MRMFVFWRLFHGETTVYHLYRLTLTTGRLNTKCAISESVQSVIIRQNGHVSLLQLIEISFK